MSYSVCGNNVGPDGFMEELYLDMTGTTERGTLSTASAISPLWSVLSGKTCENTATYCELMPYFIEKEKLFYCLRWQDCWEWHKRGGEEEAVDCTLDYCRLYGWPRATSDLLGLGRGVAARQKPDGLISAEVWHNSPVWHWPWYSGGFGAAKWSGPLRLVIYIQTNLRDHSFKHGSDLINL